MCPAGHEAAMADPLQHSQANVPTFYAHVQLAAQHVLVESVGDLEGHEVWGDVGYVLSNPRLEAWPLSESSSSTSHLTARLASTTTEPLTPTPRFRHT